MPPADVALVRTVEMFVVVGLSLALLAFSRGPGRLVLRFWAGAGAAFVVREWATQQLTAPGSPLLADRFPFPILAQVGEHMLVVLVVAGAIELRRRGSVTARPLLIATTVAVLVAWAIVSVPGLSVSQAFAWRGALAVLCAIGLLVAGIPVLQNALATRTTGAITLAGVVPLLAVERVVAGYHDMAMVRGWVVRDWFGLAPLAELILLVVGVLATVVLLLEREHLETQQGRSATARAERELHESQAYFQELIDGASDIVTVLDETGVILYESRAVERVLGWGMHENIGVSALSLVHPADQPTVAMAIERVLGGTGETATVRYRYRTKDGTFRSLESLGREIGRQRGERRFVVNTRDVTERDALEAQLVHARKLESVGRLAGGVAHDFNNMLTVIMSGTHLAESALPPAHPARRELDEVSAAAARAARLTSQLLAFSRRQPVELRRIDINELVTGLLRMLSRLVSEKTVLVLQTADDLPIILADRGQLEQVLVNLVLNARDAMPGGGDVTIRTFAASLGEEERRGGEVVAPGTYVGVSVIDTGAGVSEAMRAHLFEPFFTTKPPGQGTGLGLATCYGIVKRHGGYIWCDSAPGRGAAFSMLLPVASIAQATQPLEPSLVLDELRGNERVLLVEDDDLVRGSTRRILAEAGYEVQQAASGEPALEWLAGPIAPDVLITDVVMPRMDGVQLATQVRAQHADLPIVFVSGYSDHPDEIVSVRGSRFLMKPFSPDALLAAVRGLLDALEAPRA